MPVTSVKPAQIFSGAAGRVKEEIVPETEGFTSVWMLTEGSLVV